MISGAIASTVQVIGGNLGGCPEYIWKSLLRRLMDCRVKPGNDSGEVVRPCTERNAVQHGPDNAEILWWLVAAE
jgi:hypothetical protein